MSKNKAKAPQPEQPKRETRIRSISASYQRKINPKLYDNRRSYESVDLKFEAWAQVGEDDDPLEETRKLQEFCRDRVIEQALPLIERLAYNNKTPMVRLGTVETVFRTFCEASLPYLDDMDEEEQEEAINEEWKEFRSWIHSSEV